MINYKCPECGTQMSSPESEAGMAETCPFCSRRCNVPTLSESPPPLPDDRITEDVAVAPGLDGSPTKSNHAPAMVIKCPFCAEPISSEAKKCKHCGEWLGDMSRAHGPTSHHGNEAIRGTESHRFRKRASLAMFFSILGLLGPLWSIIGVLLANSLLQDLKAARSHEGEKEAKTALIVGGVLTIIGIIAVFWISTMMAKATMN